MANHLQSKFEEVKDFIFLLIESRFEPNMALSLIEWLCIALKSWREVSVSVVVEFQWYSTLSIADNYLQLFPIALEAKIKFFFLHHRHFTNCGIERSLKIFKKTSQFNNFISSEINFLFGNWINKWKTLKSS